MNVIDPVPALEELAAAARKVRMPVFTRLAACAAAAAAEFRQPSEPPAEHAKIIGRELYQLNAQLEAANRAQIVSSSRRLGAALQAATREIAAWAKANPGLSEMEL